MDKIIFPLISAGSLLLLSACSLLPNISQLEPTHLVVRNQSGHNIFAVSLQEKPGSSAQPIRMASVSPLLAGMEYSLRRPEKAPPLPAQAQVVITWKKGDHPVARDLQLNPSLHHATGTDNEALVVIIRANGYPTASLQSL